MPSAVLQADGLELAQQFLLALGQIGRCLHDDVTMQIAVGVCTHAFDALAAQAEDFTALGFGGNLDAGFAIQSWYLDLATQRRSGEADRHFAMQVVAVALKDAVLFDMDFHIQVAVRRAVAAGFAVAAVAQAHAAVDTCRNLDLQRFLFFHPTGAVAGAHRAS